MQLAVHHRPAPFGVGDVEEVGVGAAREADAQHLAHPGAGAVAAGDVIRLACLLGPVRPLQPRQHAGAALFEAEKLRPALDLDALRREALDQQALVRVLRVDQHVRVRAEAPTHLAEGGAGPLLAAHPEVGGRKLQPLADQRLG